MNIIIHSTPESTVSLVQVTNRGYGEQLFVSGNLITSDLFSMPRNTTPTAEQHTTKYINVDSFGREISPEDLKKIRRGMFEEYGVSIVYGGEDDEEMEVSSQPNGVSRLNQRLQELYPYTPKAVIEPITITITENVAKDLGEFITPLSNATGIPEVALYTYNRFALRASYFRKAINIISERKGIISSQHPQDTWSIYFYVVQGDKLNSICAEKHNQHCVIGSEDTVLKSRKADIAIYEAKLQDLRSRFSPEGTNRAIKNHLADLVKIQNDIGSLDVKSKSYTDWNNLRNNFANLLTNIRNEE